MEQQDGVRGLSPALSFEHFDMVNSFGTDYMHNVCLGVVKTMPKFWLDPKWKHDSYIPPHMRVKLDQRILSIKPCVFIKRLPRSLNYIGKYKASEFRSLLLYYLPVALFGILKPKYLRHFQLLSGSIYKLLETNISNDDLIVVENNLNKFVKQYEVLYGKENMTMNVHLLTHLVFCVRNLGPLWTQCMYSFESNNATFTRYVKSSNDALAELSTRYMLHKSISGKTHSFSETSDMFEHKKKIKLNSKEMSALSTVVTMDIKNEMFKIYCVYNKQNVRYTSKNYSVAKKTIDYVVQLKNEVVGKVKFYFEFKDMFYMLIAEYKYVDKIQHIHEIAPKNIESVYAAEEIDKKFIYVNFLRKHYVTIRPNQFESD